MHAFSRVRFRRVLAAGRRAWTLAAFVALGVGAGGCDAGAPSPDAATPGDARSGTEAGRPARDATPTDARTLAPDTTALDAPSPEAGPFDAGGRDARSPPSDAHAPDGPTPDAAARADARGLDGGGPDARPIDAAARPDGASPPDASPPPADAAPPSDGPPPPPDGPPPPPYHPAGYDAPAVHGADLRLGVTDCRDCHGPELQGPQGAEGARGPACDTCHVRGWRTNCTYCHGGVETQTGAPPRDLNGEADPARIRFRAHTAHTSGTTHPFYGCDECHRRPANATSPGHVFDDTPGRAEIDFSGGVSFAGAYPGNGRCASLYCHGNGTFTGDVALDAPTPDCQTCHPTARLLWPHGPHVLQAALGCEECHAATTDAPDHILAPALHVNGHVDVAIPTPTIVDGGRVCSGVCHGEDHRQRPW